MRAPEAQVQMVFTFAEAQKAAAKIKQMEDRLPELHDAAKEAAEKASESPEGREMFLVTEEIKAKKHDLLAADDDLRALMKRKRKAAKALKQSDAHADAVAAKSTAATCEASIRAESRRLTEALSNSAR